MNDEIYCQLVKNGKKNVWESKPTYSKVLNKPIGIITELRSMRKLTDVEWKMKEKQVRRKYNLKRRKFFTEIAERIVGLDRFEQKG